jgi:hypothetical protein
MASASRASTDNSSADLLKALLSVALFVHFFCVAVVLGSIFFRSPLQERLVSIFAFYTQLLDFDPGRTPYQYHYTHGTPIEDDARFEVDLYADADLPVTAQERAGSRSLPSGGTNWLGDRRKYFALSRIVAVNAQPENEIDEITGEIARAVGGRLMRETGNRRAVVRCIQRMSQPLDLAFLNPGFPPDNPRDGRYDVTVYEADVWLDEDGQLQVLKRAAAAEVAPRQTAPRRNGATGTSGGARSTPRPVSPPVQP